MLSSSYPLALHCAYQLFASVELFQECIVVGGLNVKLLHRSHGIHDRDGRFPDNGCGAFFGHWLGIKFHMMSTSYIASK